MNISAKSISRAFLSTDSPLYRDAADSLGGAYTVCKNALQLVQKIVERFGVERNSTSSPQSLSSAFMRFACMPAWSPARTSAVPYKPVIFNQIGAVPKFNLQPPKLVLGS